MTSRSRNWVCAVLVVLSPLLLMPAEARGEWRAEPGTVKLYVWWHTFGPQLPPERLQELLDLWNAVVVNARSAYLILQVPAANAPSLRAALVPYGTPQIREDFDILDFHSFPVDARLPPPEYPEEWRRREPLPAPARDAFIIQFAAPIEKEWVQDLRTAGDVLGYLPQNGYLVLGDQASLQEVFARQPIQLFRLHQPVHRITPHLRQLKAEGAVHADVTVSIAAVPEAAEAISVLAQGTVLPFGQPSSDLYSATVRTDILPRLAAMPAVVFIEAVGTVLPPGVPWPPGRSLYTVPPCRLLDTRIDPGSQSGIPLKTGQPRAFVVRGRCGIPEGAAAVSVNVTAIGATGDGSLTAYAANIGAPISRTVEFRSGRARASSAIITLDTAGYVALLAREAAAHAILDVNGYFR